MITNQLGLTPKQINCFDEFLLCGTEQALKALESMFGIHINHSSSMIELTSAARSHAMNSLRNRVVYVVSSALSGELEGQILIVLTREDYLNFCEILRPMLALLYLSTPEEDLSVLHENMPSWLCDGAPALRDEPDGNEAITDALTEMSNVLFGLYTRSISGILKLESHHSLPQVAPRAEGHTLSEVLLGPQDSDELHLIIENEFVVAEKPLGFWCAISPTADALKDMLHRVDVTEDKEPERPQAEMV